MKKKYIAPTQTIVTLHVEHHLMELSSLGVDRSTSVSEQYVKRDRSSYSVWDEDWSN